MYIPSYSISPLPFPYICLYCSLLIYSFLHPLNSLHYFPSLPLLSLIVLHTLLTLNFHHYSTLSLLLSVLTPCDLSLFNPYFPSSFISSFIPTKSFHSSLLFPLPPLSSSSFTSLTCTHTWSVNNESRGGVNLFSSRSWEPEAAGDRSHDERTKEREKTGPSKRPG